MTICGSQKNEIGLRVWCLPNKKGKQTTPAEFGIQTTNITWNMNQLKLIARTECQAIEQN